MCLQHRHSKLISTITQSLNTDAGENTSQKFFSASTPKSLFKSVKTAKMYVCNNHHQSPMLVDYLGCLVKPLPPTKLVCFYNKNTTI